MKSIIIKLDTIEKVKNFVNLISLQNGDFDLVSDRYRVDAKSIMGIFSLDLSKGLQLDVHNDAEFDKVEKLLAPFIAQDINAS